MPRNSERAPGEVRASRCRFACDTEAARWPPTAMSGLVNSRHTHVEVEFPVRTREVAVLEEEELDLPEARVVDLERVGLGPVPAIGQSDVERGPGRAALVLGPRALKHVA